MHRYRRMVMTLSRWIPGAKTCLIEALTLRKVLLANDMPGSLHLGIDRSDKDLMGAHAWVMVGEVVLIGGQDVDKFHEVAIFTW